MVIDFVDRTLHAKIADNINLILHVLRVVAVVCCKMFKRNIFASQNVSSTSGLMAITNGPLEINICKSDVINHTYIYIERSRKPSLTAVGNR
jgi:hypothetical protein